MPTNLDLYPYTIHSFFLVHVVVVHEQSGEEPPPLPVSCSCAQCMATPPPLAATLMPASRHCFPGQTPQIGTAAAAQADAQRAARKKLAEEKKAEWLRKRAAAAATTAETTAATAAQPPESQQKTFSQEILSQPTQPLPSSPSVGQQTAVSPARPLLPPQQSPLLSSVDGEAAAHHLLDPPFSQASSSREGIWRLLIRLFCSTVLIPWCPWCESCKMFYFFSSVLPLEKLLLQIHSWNSKAKHSHFPSSSMGSRLLPLPLATVHKWAVCLRSKCLAWPRTESAPCNNSSDGAVKFLEPAGFDRGLECKGNEEKQRKSYVSTGKPSSRAFGVFLSCTFKIKSEINRLPGGGVRLNGVPCS